MTRANTKQLRSIASDETAEPTTVPRSLAPTTNGSVGVVSRDLAPAISYLRVSTKEQAQKGGQDEGFSIPAQRQANAHKAEAIGARIVAEFVDAGESAKSADRPELQRMIAYVKAHRVAYCIVHKIDRLARNRADDVSIHLALQAAGVTLVSATENIDETPSGMLLHGIMSTIAEFYSRNLATEVVKGLTQKAATGGTPSKAPVGYLNVHVRNEMGRVVRTVKIDPERAELVRWAFQAYATGNWTLSQLHDELEGRGLTIPATPKRPVKPISLSSLHRMLANPYYKGDIIYRGVKYAGAHEPLVPPEVWYQVQNVLMAHNTAGDRTQRHDHYLKGTLYCGSCGSRLAISNAKSRNGNIYPYFVCAGRHRKRTPCTRSAVLLDEAERLVADYYQHNIQIPAHTREQLRGMLGAEFDHLLASSEAELAELTSRRDQLEAEQTKPIHAYYADAIALPALKREQDRIADELEHVGSRIEIFHADYAEARAELEDSLNLLGDAAAIYQRGDDETRRLCNQAFFTKLYLDEDNTVRADLARPFGILLDTDMHDRAQTWADDPPLCQTGVTHGMYESF
jgi:site-specific DNA recombinase